MTESLINFQQHDISLVARSFSLSADNYLRNCLVDTA